MTKQTLERLNEMQQAIAVCECVINDIANGYELQLKQNLKSYKGGSSHESNHQKTF